MSHPVYVEIRPQKNGASVAALVLGILAAVFAFIPVVGAAGAVLAVGGLIFAIVALVKAKRLGVGAGPGVAGLVLSVVALVGFVVVTAATVSAFVAVDEGVKELEKDLDQEGVFKEYDLETDPLKLYPNGVLGDDNQDGKVTEGEVYAKRGTSGFVKSEDLDGNGVVSWYETDKYWYDFTNSSAMELR